MFITQSLYVLFNPLSFAISGRVAQSGVFSGVKNPALRPFSLLGQSLTRIAYKSRKKEFILLWRGCPRPRRLTPIQNLWKCLKRQRVRDRAKEVTAAPE